MKVSIELKFVKSRETDLDIQQLVELITARNEDIGVLHTRTPEDARRPISKRNLPR